MTMTWKRSLAPYALAAALVLAAPAATAQAGAPTPGEQGQETVLKQGAVYPNTALGALAAIGCGLMVRATIATAGTQVGTIAGAVACCGYMLFDALVVERS